MQKSILLTLSALTLVVTSLVLSSCGKDDENPVHPKLSFFDEDMNVNEDDGVIEIKVVLDKAYSKDLAIDYDVDGTATEGPLVTNDYEIDGDFGEVVIEAGETEGIIEIEIKNDALFEGDETIVLTIDDVNSDDVEIDLDETVITIEDNEASPSVAFTSTTLTTDETEGSQDLTLIEVKLSAAAGKDITVSYELGGTALDTLRGDALNAPIRYYDYYINSEDAAYASEVTSGEIVIPAGETSASIELQLFTDFIFENTETITLTLTTASDGVAIGTNDEFQINLLQEDGRAIELSWESAVDVDMDLFFWVLNASGVPSGILDIAATGGTDFERTFLPSWALDNEDDVSLGMSYTYYSGTDNSLDFTVIFADFEDGVLEGAVDFDEFNAIYTLANINVWDDDGGIFPPPVAQSFDIIDGQFANISDITVAGTGSRQREAKLSAANFQGTRAMAKGQFKRIKPVGAVPKARKSLNLSGK